MIDSLDNSFEDIHVGMKKKFKVTVTEKMMDEFAVLSGDYNPLHMDSEYTKTTNFKKRICHGMLLASFFSRLVGMYIPGKKSLYLTQSLKFVQPCFADDEVTIIGEVISKSDSSRIITVKTEINNNDNVSLVKGEAKVLVRD